MNTFLLVSTIFLLVLQIPIIFGLVMAIRSLNIVYLQAMSTAGIPLGRGIPEFARKSVTSGKTVSNEVISGKPTLLGFVSHSCKRCKSMLPHWNKAYNQYKDDYNFVLIGHGNEAQFKKLLKELDIKGELVAGVDLFDAFKAKLVAFAYFIDVDGKVQRKGLCENMEDIEDLLAVQEMKKNTKTAS